MSKSLLKKKINSKTLKPGHYVLRYNSIERNCDYLDPAYEFKYTVVNKNGDHFPFSEIFIEKNGFTRTEEYFDYLSNHGIEDLNELPGKCELIHLVWNFGRYGKKFLSISKRDFITENEFNSREVLGNASTSP